MHNLFNHIQEATSYIRSKTKQTNLKVGIVLGTGLGALAQEMDVEIKIPYEQIPHFVKSTLEFHQGELLIGLLAGKKVVMMNGRFHLYEGYTVEQITFPIRVMKALGVETLILSNACGTVNPNFQAGDILVVKDHINLLGANPLIGTNDERLGARFPDMSQPYSSKYRDRIKELAKEKNIDLKEGVYAAMTGPCLETAAEYRMLQIMGADVIGMSTIPEVIVAVHSQLSVLTLSIITDECFPESLDPVDISKVIATAKGAEPKLTSLVKVFLQQL